MRDELLPAWGCRLVSTLLWLKVTSRCVRGACGLCVLQDACLLTAGRGSGEPVIPLDSGAVRHRLPWERLLVARRPCPCEAGGVSGLSHHARSLCQGGSRPLPASGVFCSVPRAHSEKPPVGELLAEFLPGLGGGGDVAKAPPSLELFARRLYRGCTAWGNQALLLQHVSQWTSRG